MKKEGSNLDFCMYCGERLEKTGDYCHDKPELLVGECSSCSLKQVLDFSHVTTETYENLSSEDFYKDGTDLQIERKRLYKWNTSRISKIKEFIPNIKKRTVLDYGCGSGGFIEQAQSAFKKAVGFDVSDQICKTHKDYGWECYSSLKDINTQYDIITLFNVLEHVPKSWEFLVDLKNSFKNSKYFVFEVPNTDESLISVFNNSAYRKNHHASLHVYYYTKKTIRQIIERAEFEILFETQYQRYTLANNIGWMNDNEKGGQDRYTIFNDDQLNREYERVLVTNGIADSNFFICKAKS